MQTDRCDVAIVGSGPAGLTAAIYTQRGRLKTLVFEDPSAISHAAYAPSIENYPGFTEPISGLVLIEAFKKQAKKFGAEFRHEAINNITAAATESKGVLMLNSENRTYEALAIIIASGTKPKELGAKGEKDLIGKGVSYCATCDGPLFKDRDVVVVGGGNSALEEALFLTKFAKKVTIIHRRDKLRAVKALQEQTLSNNKIEVMWDSELKEIRGRDAIESVTVKETKTDKEKQIPCKGIFISVGFVPNTTFVKDMVKLDPEGYIVTDNRMITSQAGIFACGDCRNTPIRQVITACGDGAIAAASCQQYLETRRYEKG